MLYLGWPTKHPVNAEQILPSCVRSASSSTGFYDNVNNYWSKHPEQYHDQNDVVWQKQGVQSAEAENVNGQTTTMNMSLASSVLKKMIDPLPETVVGAPKQVAFCTKHGTIANAPSTASVTAADETRPTIHPAMVNASIVRRPSATHSNIVDYKSSLSQPHYSPSSSSSLDNDQTSCDVVLKQNDRQISVVTTPKMKRSSIHLIASQSGHLRSTERLSKSTTSAAPTAIDADADADVVFAGFKELDDTNSFNSSIEGSTTSQQSGAGAKECPMTNNNVRKAGSVTTLKNLHKYCTFPFLFFNFQLCSDEKMASIAQ